MLPLFDIRMRIVLLLLSLDGVLEHLRFFCCGFGDGDSDPIHVAIYVQRFRSVAIEVAGVAVVLRGRQAAGLLR